MKEIASSSTRKSRDPSPRGMSSMARRTIRAIASGASGSRTTTLQRERSAPFSSKEGFSVVAPIRMTSPVSTYGRKTSCCARLKRWISSKNSVVPCPAFERSARDPSRTSRISLTPVAIAEYARNRVDVRAAISRASVVLPTPGGPQKTSEGTRSSAIARDRKPLAPTTSSGPSTSSSERGRMRSASGPAGELSEPRRPDSSRSKRSPVIRPRASGGTRPSKRARSRCPVVRRPRAAGRSTSRRPDPGSSPPPARRALSAASPPIRRRKRGGAPSGSRRRERRRRRGSRRGSRRPQAGNALLDPIEVRDLRVLALELVEPPLRGGRILPVVGVKEHEVQERLPVIRVVLPSALEEGRGAAELPAVAVRGAEVREKVRILRSFPPRLLVSRDRPVPVRPVEPGVPERRQQLRVLRIALDGLLQLLQTIAPPAGRRVRDGRRARRTPAA